MILSRFLITPALSLFFVTFLFAQDATVPEKPVLGEGDVKRFVQTFPVMAKQFEALGQEFESVEDLSALQSLAANTQVQQILQQHGWKQETYFQKMMAIVMGFAGIEMEKQIAEMPADQQAMMRQMLQGQMAQFQVHPKDKAQIQAQEAELRKLFESME